MPGDFPGPTKDTLDFTAMVLAATNPPAPRRPIYAPKRVRARHRMVAMLAECGWPNDQIAKATGYTEGRVAIILNSRHPELLDLRANFASKIADQIVDVQSRIQLYAGEMLDIMVEHARDKGEKINSRLAARDLLHMAGFSPIKRELQMQAKVPFDELKGVLGRIKEAQQVVQRRAEWAVTSGTPK